MLTLVLYFVPFAYQRLVLKRDPAWLSHATYLDVDDVALTAFPYLLAVSLLAFFGVCIARVAGRLTAVCVAPDPREWSCVAACLALPIGGALTNGVDDAIVIVCGGVAAWYSVAVAALRLASPPVVQTPSKLAAWCAHGVAGCLVLTSVTNVRRDGGELPSVHGHAAAAAYMLSFPMVVCLRSQSTAALAYLAIAATSLVGFVVEFDGPAGAMKPKYFCELVGQMMLSWAFVAASVRVLR